MDFSKGLAASMARKTCKWCWGRGWVEITNSPGGPIVKQKKDEDGNIVVLGSIITKTTDFCQCSRTKLEKLEKKAMEKVDG